MSGGDGLAELGFYFSIKFFSILAIVIFVLCSLIFIIIILFVQWIIKFCKQDKKKSHEQIEKPIGKKYSHFTMDVYTINQIFKIDSDGKISISEEVGIIQTPEGAKLALIQDFKKIQ